MEQVARATGQVTAKSMTVAVENNLMIMNN